MRYSSLILIIITVFLFFTCCQSDNSVSHIASDSLSINRGQVLFSQHCSGCHNFKQDGIGPNLGGLTTLVDASWISKFIKNPKHVIESGDIRAQQLFSKYQTIMPPFDAFSVEEMNNLLSYLHSHKTNSNTSIEDPEAILDPIPERVVVSDLVLSLKQAYHIPPTSNQPPLARIVKMEVQPETTNLFILDLRGKLYKLEKDTSILYMDLASLKPNFIHKPGLGTGFGSFAFHPKFANNGLLYTTHTEPANAGKADFYFHDSLKVALQWVLTEWKTNNPSAETFEGKPRELLRINMLTPLHGVQDIVFNPLAHPGDEDYGQLYIGVGDGGSVENGHPEFVKDFNKIWGTILRIDPSRNNSANKKYGFPNEKSFGSGAPGEIYAKGFRNPNRITWLQSGEMLATNIGHANIESVNIILKGHNYGWPIREGTFAIRTNKNLTKVFPLPQNDSMFRITYPVIQYDHDEGKAIAGGYEYLGKEVPQLKGKYVFGDILTGRLFYSEVMELKTGNRAKVKEWRIVVNGKQTTLRELCGNHRVDLRLGRDHSGEMYLFTKADGKVYRIHGGSN